MGQPKIWLGRPKILVVLALTKCLVEINQTVQPKTKLVWLDSLVDSNQIFQPN
jgi:hypothetical protein